MSVARRLLLLVIVSLLAGSVALTALATEDPETTTDTSTETTVASEGGGQNVPAPAVTVPPTAAGDETPDWTYRYLIPTLLALAVIVVIVTTVQYFVRVVRNRYKVVE